jgi:PAP_fibrillin
VQVELEAFGGELDFERLPGLWRLLYTTAEDVVRCCGGMRTMQDVFLEFARAVSSVVSPQLPESKHNTLWSVQRPLAGLNRLPLSPLHVGDIYQRFSGPDAGTVQNVIEFSVPSLLSSRPAVSGTFVVDASYTVQSSRRIALTFQSANLRE